MGEFIITKDGALAEWAGRRYSSELEALGGLHKLVGYSADHAMRHEGYALAEVPADKWSELEAAAILPPRGPAERMFRHTHAATIYPKEDRAVVRENCAACCLEGYTSDTERIPSARFLNKNGPNVANWQRDYVQARRVIPARWREAFYAFEASDNEPWKAGLRRDIATFGVRFADDVEAAR